MTSQTDAKGNVTNYTYNNKDQLTSVSQGGISVSYAYDSNNQLSTITHNGFTYNFIYDAFGRSDKVQIGTRFLVDNMYEAETGLLQKSTYGNGDTREYEYDSKHRVTKLIIDNVDRFSYNYDNLGNLHSYTDLVQNITYTYLYDFLGRPVQVRTSSGFRIKLTYDEYNRASDVKFEFGSNGLSTSWIYGKSSVVYGVKYNGTEKLSYTYDTLMRRSKTTINTSTPFVTTYGYKDISLDKTTTQLNSISYSNGKGFVYTYDANGNILTIKDQNNTLLANYTYDALNQLTREDNAQLNKTITYTYDNGGNILSIKKYAFTTGELGSVTNEKTYTYGNSEWKDLLTNYNGTDISYDTIGNPLNWINGETFTWSGGRQLIGITKGNTNISYTYNDDNIRTSKTVNGVRTDYYLNGIAVIMQKTGDNCIWYTYDENGLVSGFRYNGNEYYYFKNAQGDIIGIIDSSGTVVANYTYDSWGKHIAITDGNGNDISTDLSHIANINPFRYRGYYFDNETGFYYVSSRYYDPEIGRWINVDGELSDVGGDILGYNLFAYCFNNPVNMDDPSGNLPKWLSGALNVVGGALQIAAGAALGATVGWTGFGAVVAGFLIVNGTATAAQGFGQIVNHVTNSNVMREDNIVRTGVQEVGRAIGGDTGAKIAGGAYDVAAIAANLYAGKVGLQQAGKLPIKVNINNVVNNPLDEFVTIGPADGVIQQYCRTIPQSGYGQIYATQLGNGLYQIANGHHRVAALRALGYKTIKIFLTK